jgi:hypothetical protein
VREAEGVGPSRGGPRASTHDGIYRLYIASGYHVNHRKVTLHEGGPKRGPPPRAAGRDAMGVENESMAAYPQLIVTTRLLYSLQDRIEQLSRMQRFYPHAW